jgi:hypothetical protein
VGLTTLVFVSVMAAGGATAEAQPQPPAEALPVSIDRIRKVLAQPQTISPDGVPVFRVEVFGEKPNLEALLGKEFWKGGAPPTPGGAGMTHQEFLANVTPPEFRGTAMYTQGEAIGMMAMGVVLQWVVEKAVQKLEKAIQRYRAARKVRVQEQARKEVQEALAALDRARAAGLPRNNK